MLEKQYIESTLTTPRVVLDNENGKILFSGRSLPEDCDKFYSPILDWINIYSENPPTQTSVVFNFEYYNSASLKKFVDIMLALKNITKQGGNINIKWYYEQDDETSMENAEDLGYASNLDIEIIEKDNNI